MSHTVTVGIIGLGYWGPNLLRNFLAEDRARVKYACDMKEENLAKFRHRHPTVQFTAKMDDVLDDPEVDAVVIATPLASHVALATAALEKGKHVLVEKPLAPSAAEARQLVELAKKRKKILLTDHPFLFESAVDKIAQYAKDGTLGKLLYFDSTRINLGLLRSDANVLWDLAVHDLSILDTLEPLSGVTEVLAHGQKHHTDKEEIAHLFLRFASGFTAHIHVSWLSPVKLRQTLVGGTQKMIVYNDNDPSEKIRLYDRGVDVKLTATQDGTSPDTLHSSNRAEPRTAPRRGAGARVKKEEQTFALPVYRSGDVLIPNIRGAEPLRALAGHFVECIQGKATPRTPGEQAVRILEILEASNRSMESNSTISLTH